MATYYNLFYYIIRLFSVSFRGKIVSFSRKPRFSACARSVFLLQLRQQGGGTVNTQKRNLCAAGVLLTAAATMVVLFVSSVATGQSATIHFSELHGIRSGWLDILHRSRANRTCVRFWWLHRRRTGGRRRSCCSGAHHGGTRRTMLFAV